MKLLLPALLCIFLVNAQAQRLHADLYVGAANYQGDLQTKRFDLRQSKPAIGLGLSYNLTNKLIARGAASYMKVSGQDEQGNSAKDVAFRNLSFRSTVWEAQLGLEYNLLDIEERGFSPYVFAGLAAFHFNPYAYDSANNKVFLRTLGTEGQGLSQYPEKTLYKNNQFAIPFGGGVKLALTDRFQVGIELGLRKLFTDYLDDVSGTYADSSILAAARGPQAAAFAFRGREISNSASYPAAGAIRGNSKNKDWYYITAFRFSYALGSGAGTGGKRSKMGCPTGVY